MATKDTVCFPYEFTLLSNKHITIGNPTVFVSPTNLHYSQTDHVPYVKKKGFVSPTNLHYSQTLPFVGNIGLKFVSPTNLHYSQTLNLYMIVKM